MVGWSRLNIIITTEVVNINTRNSSTRTIKNIFSATVCVLHDCDVGNDNRAYIIWGIINIEMQTVATIKSLAHVLQGLCNQKFYTRILLHYHDMAVVKYDQQKIQAFDFSIYVIVCEQWVTVTDLDRQRFAYLLMFLGQLVVCGIQ